MQNSMAAEERCSALPWGSCQIMWTSSPPPSTHMQILQVSEVFRPLVLNLSCTLELLGSFGKWRYLVLLLGVCLSWPGLRPGHQDLEKLPG